MSTTQKTVATPAMQAFNIADLATQAPISATSLEAIESGQSIDGIITNVQQMAPINGKAVCRIYVNCAAFNRSFNALLDGTLAEVLPLKGLDATLVFRGVNTVGGQSYPKFSVLF